VRGKFIGGLICMRYVELGDRGKAARSSRISAKVKVQGGKDE